jgi:uncharacterized protein (UPF0276 family)
MLISGALRADYLETSGPLADTAAALLPRQPMLLHNSVWDWSLGHPAALEQREVLPRTLRALRRTRAPWFSLYLGFGAAEVGFDKGRMRARTTLLGREELFENIVRNVQGLATAIPVPLFLENLDYNPGGAYEHVCQPEFIAAVLEESEADPLLDLAHARVSASRLGFSTPDYLTRLPLERVRQIHFSGPRPRYGVLVDAHEPLQEEDYGLLQNLLDVTTPRALTREYDRNEDALKKQVSQLRDILKRRR